MALAAVLAGPAWGTEKTVINAGVAPGTSIWQLWIAPRFSCFVTAGVPSGFHLFIGSEVDGRSYFGFAKDGWRLNEGATYTFKVVTESGAGG